MSGESKNYAQHRAIASEAPQSCGETYNRCMVNETNDCDQRELPCRVIVAGYGPVGRVVTDELETAGMAVKVVELNLVTVERRMALGKPVAYGDVTDRQTLERAGIKEADALILAIPNENVAVEACRLARSLAPDLFIAVRTNFVSKGMLAKQAGADHVTIEEVVTAQAMSGAVLGRLVNRGCGEE